MTYVGRHSHGVFPRSSLCTLSSVFSHYESKWIFLASNCLIIPYSLWSICV